MTKAKLIFDLDDPDDIRRLKVALQADYVLSAIYEFDQWLRSQHKHGPSGRMAQYVEIGCEECKADYEAMMEDVRIRFGEVLAEAGVEVEL